MKDRNVGGGMGIGQLSTANQGLLLVRTEGKKTAVERRAITAHRYLKKKMTRHWETTGEMFPN